MTCFYVLSYNNGTWNNEENISSYWMTLRKREDIGN
jgi:hypothetical protein